tara:strand:- start:180 stop:929 length:750 start_codon:yes stop_codon:yes gene_type:complete
MEVPNKYIAIVILIPVLAFLVAIGLIFALPKPDWTVKSPAPETQGGFTVTAINSDLPQTINLDWTDTNIGTSTFSALDLGSNTALTYGIRVYSQNPTTDRGRIQLLRAIGNKCPSWSIANSNLYEGVVSGNDSDGHSFGNPQTSTVSNIVIGSDRGETEGTNYSSSTADWLNIEVNSGTTIRALELIGLNADLPCLFDGLNVGAFDFQDNITGDGSGINSASLVFETTTKNGLLVNFTDNEDDKPLDVR